MHKIDAPHATASNEFTDGNPALGIEATELIAKWFNTVQRELVALVQYAGLTLSDIDDDQITEAITALLSAHANLTAPHSATAAATAERLVVRDSAGRASFAPGTTGGEAVVFSQFEHDFSAKWAKLPGGLIIQWGQALSDVENAWVTRSFNITYPNAALIIVGIGDAGAVTLDPDIRLNILSTSQFRIWNTGYENSLVNWISLGR